jgi:hypothetical protein
MVLIWMIVGFVVEVCLAIAALTTQNLTVWNVLAAFLLFMAILALLLIFLSFLVPIVEDDDEFE